MAGSNMGMQDFEMDELSENTLYDQVTALGSMNMDEFLSRISIAEGNQFINTSDPPPFLINNNTTTNGDSFLINEMNNGNGNSFLLNEMNNGGGNTLLIDEIMNNNNGNTFFNEMNNDNGNTFHNEMNNENANTFLINENNNDGNTFLFNEMNNENGNTNFLINENNNDGNTNFLINENNNDGNTNFLINENNNEGNTFLVNENNLNNGSTIIINENNTSGNTIIMDENNGNTVIINENNNNTSNTIAQIGMASLGQAPVQGQGIAIQPSLAPQPSLPNPATLSNTPNVNVPNPNQSAALDQTVGEMTLEDFLVKVGICRKSAPPPQNQIPPPQPHPQQFVMYHNNNRNIPPRFVGRTMMRMPGGIGAAAAGVSAFHGMPQGGGVIREPSGYRGNGYRNAAMFPPQRLAVAYGGRFELGQTIGIPAPINHITPDGVLYAATAIHTPAGQFGMGMHSLRGRKRNIDSSAETMEERKHRRMIKNRESAARSRARKQAYTLALEAELDKLREENSQLKQALMERERKRKQQLRVNEVKMKAYVRDERAKEKMKALKRTSSGSM